MGFYAAFVLYASILPIGLFLFYYVSRSKWRSTPLGKIIVGLLVSLLAMLGIGLVAYTIDPEWLNWVRLGVYGFMNAGLWYLFWILRVVQRSDCDGTREPTDVQKMWRKLTRRKRD